MKNIPTKIQIGKRLFAVSGTTKQGRKSISAPKGKVYLKPEGEAAYLSEWPIRLHADTFYKEWHDAA